MMIPANQKVTADHLQRKAYLYVRQSTLQQLRRHQESTQRQYALEQRARDLGWPAGKIEIIDSDLGQSGASSKDREGFQRLVSEVGMRQAGIVLGLEVSRLARNNTDWHHLLEICGLTQTLILDEDGLYNPCDFNDRLLLGLKGTMSEAELHILKARMRGGILNKAKRGELHLHLPVGFVYDDEGKVVLDPDQQIRQTIYLLFATYRRVGTARRVVAHFRKEGILFPRHPHGRTNQAPVWKPPSASLVRDVLHNPRYAGAFAYGQTQELRQADGRVRRIRKPREAWLFLIKDTHEGYITWQDYEANQRQLERWSRRMRGMGSSQSPPREGCALLQGLVVCGLCGRRMQSHYHKRGDQRIPQYNCTWEQMEYGSSRCQGVTGDELDRAVAGLVLETVTPMALEVALNVQQEMQRRLDETDTIRRQQVDRIEYEVELARRRYMQVDPDNRLVAQSLETHWNEKLVALENARQQYERSCQADRLAMNEQDRNQILALATDLPRLWKSSNVSNRDRKRVIRLLIEDITLIVGENQVTAHVRFKGGANRTLTIPKPKPAWEQRQTNPKVVQLIDRLLDDHHDGQVASILNQRNYRSGTGLEFTGPRVCELQRRYGLKTRYERLRNRGMLSVEEVADRLNIYVGTARAWQRRGLLTRHEYTKNRYLYEPPAETLVYRKFKHFNKNMRQTRAIAEHPKHFSNEVQYEA